MPSEFAQRRRINVRVVAAVALVAAIVAIVLVIALGGETVDPFAYSPARRAMFEQQAADGESHLLYADSPGGAIATARRVAALERPIQAAAAAAHVDPGAIEGMIFLESGGRADAIAGGDPRGAAGVSQILPSTATSLLGLHVDLRASVSLTKQIAAAQHAHDGAAVGQLERKRRAVDERFDPNKALAATGRYLTFAEQKLDRGDLAVESYHMGVGNLANVIRSYTGTHDLADKLVRDRKLTYAQLYFDSTPLHHQAAYRLLAAFGDDSDTYYWRVLAARHIMRLYRQSPTELARLNVLQTTYGSGEAVLHPPDTPVFDDAASLAAARRSGTLKAIPHGRYFAVDPALPAQARQLGRDPKLYTTLRPEALGVVYYLADRVHSISRQKAPLLVAAAARDISYEDALAVRKVAAPSGYSLYTTGFSFDVKRHYASHAQAEAFQAMLDRLQALDVIAWQREADVIHVTVSNRAKGLIPLINGAALGDAS
jgi:hypothetical protein